MQSIKTVSSRQHGAPLLTTAHRFDTLHLVAHRFDTLHLVARGTGATKCRVSKR